MGRQVEKLRKKTLSEVNENLATEKETPVADENKHIKQGSLFSCASVLLIIFTVIVAIIIASVLVKAAELQQLNDDQEQTIMQMSANAENLKQKFKKAHLESSENAKQKEVLIKSLQSEKDDLDAKIIGFVIQLANADKTISEYKKTEIALKEENKNKDDKITYLSLDMNDSIEAFKTEKKIILDNLAKSEQEKSSVQQNCELALSNISSVKEAETKELNSILLKKDDEILTKLQTIQSLKGQSETLYYEKSELSENIESLNLKNTQTTAELVLKSETIESLKEESLKCSNNLVVFRDERNKEVSILEQEKTNCIKDHEISTKTHLEDIQIEIENIRKLKDENQILEKTTKERIITLENEHKNQLDVLEDSKAALMDILKSERKEKNNVLDEKTSLARALEDLQLEADNVILNLKMSQTDLEKCKKDKLIESDQKKELEKKVTVLSDTKLQIESDCKETAEKLSKMELEKEELNKQFKKKTVNE